MNKKSIILIGGTNEWIKYWKLNIWNKGNSDLAKLYNCKNGTKSINLAVSRNRERFPEDFYFQLTEEECQVLRSQIRTLNDGYENRLRFQIETLNSKGNMRGQHIKYLPYAFAEQGVAMLATILKTNVAAQTSINIMRAFVEMKKYISSSLLEQRYFNDLVIRHDYDIKLLQTSFQKFEEKRKDNEIYFNGQIYDAYSKVLEIFSLSKSELIIVDSYADKVLLDIIRRLKVKVIIITKENLLTNGDIDNYNRQYSNLKVIHDNTFHDRYFIIDQSTIYHCGSSINRIGYKTFSINLISDKDTYKPLLKKINEIIN